MKRRQFINSIGAGAGLTALGLSAGCAAVGGSNGKVVVIGGGFSGGHGRQVHSHVVGGCHCGHVDRAKSRLRVMPHFQLGLGWCQADGRYHDLLRQLKKSPLDSDGARHGRCC